jgi:hypothetical protein
MSDTLSRLLSPMDTAVFFERYWSREYVHLQRPVVPCTDWLNLDDLDRLFQSELLPAAFFNVVAEGTQVPREDWSRERSSDRGRHQAVDTERLFQCYLNGATLILNQAQHSIPRLSRACRLLTRELGFRVWANIYITPPDSAGFDRHQDDHEVLILQILGSKLWTVYPNAGEPVDLGLERGDLLYLPRSTPHSARSGNARSIHITFGLSPAYAFDLVEELAVVARAHPAFQQMAPHACFGTPAGEEFETEFAAKLTALLEQTGVGGLLERRLQTLGKNQGQGWPGRFEDLVHLGDISPKTIVRRRPGILFAVREQDGLVEVHFAGRSVSMPAFLRSCLEPITSETPFAIESVHGLISGEGKVELVRSLVRVGLLEIVEIG